MDRPIPVLCWHKVSPRLEPGITVVSPRRFELQLRAVADNGFRTLNPAEYLERKGRMSQDESCCLLTFDDAYACVEEHALPLMVEFGFTGILFPVLDYIGRPNLWDRGLLGRRFDHMGQDALTRMLAKGWSLGLHGATHKPLDRQPLEVLDRELVEARSELECQFGQNVHLLAWPFGLCDRRAVRVAQATGLRSAFGRCSIEHPFCQSRYMIYPFHGSESIREMLAGGPQDRLQRLAAMGAGLSARLHGRG